MPSIQLVEMDFSEEMIKAAKKNVPSGEFIVQDIRKLNFVRNTFNGALASFCLPYLDNNEASNLLKDINKLLKNKGFVYICTMQGEGSEISEESFTRGKKLFKNYYRKEFLEGLFFKFGFKIVDNFLVNSDLIYILQKDKETSSYD